MNHTQYNDFQALLRCLAQEKSLLMINLVSQREYAITELAQVLALSEAIITDHVNQLRQLGLLRLRMVDKQPVYASNPKRLATLKYYMQVIDEAITDEPQPSADDAWIDQLDWCDDDKKILKEHTSNGRLTHFPIKEKKWLPIVKWLASHFEQGKQYSEQEVNAILIPLYPDYAATRRSLIDYGLMQRNSGGRQYWLIPESERL